MYRSPKYWKEMKEIRKKFLREQADKRASERAGGRVGPRATSRRAIKRLKRTRASSAEYVPNHLLRGKVFHGGLQADRGPLYSRKVLRG